MKILSFSALAATFLWSTGAVQTSQGHRRDAIGDFDELNTLFENASIELPDSFEVSGRRGVAMLDMTISNMVCDEMSVGDIAISHTRESAQAIDVNVDIYALDLNCVMDYVYSYGFLRGDGTVKLTTDDSMASTSLRFVSNDFDANPPTGSSVDRCVTNIEILRMEFEGDVVGEIIEFFQSLIRGAVEQEIGKVACEELGSLGTTFVTNILDLADEKLEPYLGPVSDEFTDPLYVEQNINLPSDLVPLDLQASDNAVSKLFGQALDGVDLFLGALIADDSQITREGRDLAINVFLRDYLLDDNRAFVLDASQLPLDSTVFFDGHDNLFETTMTLNQVKIFGFDTMSLFNPFIEIGSYTLQNKLAWNKLTVEFDVTVDIKPSSLDDAILKDPTSNGISERITVDFGVDNLDVLASLLLVIDEEKLGAIQLGSLLYTEDFIPCLLSVVNQAQLVGLDVDPEVVNEPTLNGFISPGLDRIISDSALAAFAMYTGVLRESLPSIFQTSVTSFVNEFVVDPFMSDSQSTSCPAVQPMEGLINFNEFFGDNEKFGDVPPMLKDLVDSELLTADQDTGSLRINKALIAPMTKRQSGQEGTLRLEGDIFNLFAESVPQFGMDSIQLRTSEMRLDNLHSFTAPANLLEPNTTKPYALGNTINVGSDPASLQMGIKGLFALQGDPALTMRNELELQLNLAGSELVADVLAKMDADAFVTFPLQDIVNIDCWLATLVTPKLDESGRLLVRSDAGLSLESLVLAIPTMRMNVVCVNCTSDVLAILPDLFEMWSDDGISDVMESHLLDVGLGLLRGEFAQDYVNRLLVNGALRCPHSPAFVSTSAESEYPVPEYPSLPYDSLESVAFAATVMMHMATVVIAEAHDEYDLDSTTPLSGQAKLGDVDEGRFVDFSALDSSLGEWASTSIDQLLEYLNTVIDDNNGPDGKDLRINNILRSNLLDNEGGINLQFNDLGVGGDDTEITLKHIRVLGLDSIETLEVLDVIAPQTLQNKLRFKKLGLQIVFSLMGTDSTTSQSKTREDITISLVLADVDISLALLLAMDLDLLGSLQLSSILNIKNMIPCILSAARDAQLTELEVTAGAVEDFSVEGFRSEELRTAATKSSNLVLEKYGAKILSSMPGFFDLTVRALANNWMQYMMGEWSAVACPKSQFELAGVTSFVDFRDLLLSASQSLLLGGGGASPYGDFFRTVVGFVQDVIFSINDTTGLSALNGVLVGPLTRGQSGTTGSLIFPGELLGSETRVQVGALDTNVVLRATNARVNNLDTIGSPLEVLKASDEAHQLNNTATFGAGDLSLRFAINLLVALTGDDELEIRNEMEISVDLSQVTVVLEAMMMVAESRFYEFPLRDTLDYNCWLATIPAPEMNSQGVRVEGTSAAAALAQLAASVAQVNVNVSCIECSSPRMPEFARLISSTAVQDDVTAVSNEVLAYVSELAGGNYVQVQIDRLLHDAARRCPHSPLYDTDFVSAVYEPFEAPDTDYVVSYLVMLGGVTLALILLVAIVVFVVRFVVRRRHKKWLGGLPPHQVRTLANLQGKEQQLEANMNASTRSMFTSPEIPLFVRWSMPLIILGNIAFFLSGHFSLGATVNIEADIAGEKLSVEKFFEFSIARSTVDIWNAGGRELAIMILIFSGIWPYTKQLITLALWFVPPTRVSTSRRGSILLWLDFLAKWSMVDVFVLVMSIVAFRVSVESPGVSFLPDNFYSIDMMVVPLWGLYANLLAQLISQVSSHFIIHYHRRIVEQAHKGIQQRHHQGGESGVYMHGDPKNASLVSVDQSLQSADTLAEILQRQALRKHQFSRPHRGETERLVLRRGVNGTLWLGVVLLTAFIIIGCSIPTFSVETFGIVGVAVEFGQDFEDATTSHSVFSVLQLLFDQARFLDSAADYLGMFSLCVLLFTTVLLVPIVQALALMRQWFFPSTRKTRARMAVFIEILQSWQYVEVYLLAVFVASWQLGPISQYMINAYCENLKDMFSQAIYYGILSEEDAQCFSVQSSVESGSFVLAAGAVMLALINTFVSKGVIQYFRDKDAFKKRAMHDGNQSDSGLTTVSDEEQDQSADAGFSARIQPVPVLFTDTFRWLLRPDNSLPASSRALFADASGDHWDLPEAQAIAYDDDTDSKMIHGQYVSNEDGMDTKLRSSGRNSTSGLSRKRSSPPNSAAAPTSRRLTFEDEETSPLQGSAMDSMSDSQSLNGDGWPRSVASMGQGNLKDDQTYATPPGENRMHSQPPSPRRVPIRSISATQSIALSAARSAAPSTGSSRRTAPRDDFQEELSLEEQQTVESLLQEEEDYHTEVSTNDGRSEYVEETVDEDYEEYTVNSMSDSNEVYEDLSEYDSQAHQVV